jgi:uncharacterized protein YoxC
MMDLLTFITGKPGAGAEVLDRFERKLDLQAETLAAVRSDVAVLKGKGDDLSRMEVMVGENARQIASLASTVASLAKSMEGLEARVDKGEGQIAALNRLGEDVKSLKEADEKVVKDLEGVKKTINRWGGGLVVAGIVGGAVWGILGVKLTADVAPPAPAPVIMLPSAPPAQPEQEPRRRQR